MAPNPRHVGDCVLWAKATNNMGYGVVGDGHTRTVLAHRLAWIEEHGPIADGLCVCHRCDNPACVNVDHLFLGTHAENMRDAAEKGRVHPGEPHGMSKLTEEQVLEIRARRDRGEGQRDLAAEFGITQGTVSSVCLRTTWRHV